MLCAKPRQEDRIHCLFSNGIVNNLEGYFRLIVSLWELDFYRCMTH